MIRLSERHRVHDARAKRWLREVFEFRNSKAAVVINDVNYWTFGELEKDIPSAYYGADPGVSMQYQIGKINRHYESFPDDCYIGFLRPWFGTAVLASGFGAPIVFPDKADPVAGLSKIETIEEVRKLEIPDPSTSGIMPRVIEAIEYYKDSCDLTVAITDCQGPLTTALSIVGYDKFCYWIHDYPRVMHELMEKITDALISWVKYQKELCGIPIDGEAYPVGVWLPEGFGGAEISDDEAVMFGPELYREFVVPCNSRFLQAFGGGCIHYCGTATQHIDNFLATKGLTAINNFNLDNLGEAGKMREALAEKGIVYMGCDFTPGDRRLGSYYEEFFRVMKSQTGLVVASYIAPAVALESGKYSEGERDQLALARETYRIICQNL
jgi:hypothetical protein